jgi:ACS family tartrate transporter-like MFS transporter
MDIGLVTKRVINYRILGVLFFVNFMATVDRSNLSFASVDFVEERGFSASVYGFGAGIFFLGLALAGVPHTLVFQRIRPHVWLAGMMAVWSLASVLTALVTGPEQFFVVRFILGAAEGALVPVAVACLARFYSAADVGAAAATYVSAGALAAALGGPFSAAILAVDWPGLEAWQWLFVIQAIPLMLLAPFFPRLVPESPSEASWLSAESKQWLSKNTTDPSVRTATTARDLLQSLLSMQVLVLTATFFCINLALWGLTFWLPQIVKVRFSNLNSSQVSLLSSGAFIAAFVAMWAFGRLASRTGERRWTLIGLLAASGLSLTLSLLVSGDVAPLILVSLGLALSFGMVSVFYGIAATTLIGATGPTKVSVVNGVGLLGGFVGPYLFGALRDLTGSPTAGLYLFAAVFGIGIVLVAAGGRYFPRLKHPDGVRAGGGAAEEALAR